MDNLRIFPFSLSISLVPWFPYPYLPRLPPYLGNSHNFGPKELSKITLAILNLQLSKELWYHSQLTRLGWLNLQLALLGWHHSQLYLFHLQLSLFGWTHLQLHLFHLNLQLSTFGFSHLQLPIFGLEFFCSWLNLVVLCSWINMSCSYIKVICS